MEKIILILVIFVSGCAATTRTEYVPTTNIEPPVIERPVLDTDYLEPGMEPGEVVQLHRLTILKLQQWGLTLENALNVYRTK